MFGRLGLLAHPYVLGPKASTNGCLCFKDYNVFQPAYQTGQVTSPHGRRGAVVERGFLISSNQLATWRRPLLPPRFLTLLPNENGRWRVNSQRR
jgi:hypothetical protein